MIAVASASPMLPQPPCSCWGCCSPLAVPPTGRLEAQAPAPPRRDRACRRRARGRQRRGARVRQCAPGPGGGARGGPAPHRWPSPRSAPPPTPPARDPRQHRGGVRPDRTRCYHLLPVRDLARQSRRHAAHPWRGGPVPRPARRHSRSPLRRQAYGCDHLRLFLRRLRPRAAPDRNRIILTAAARDRPSFGCSDDLTYTYFDEALLKVLPGSRRWDELYANLKAEVTVRERELGARPSLPQASFGGSCRRASFCGPESASMGAVLRQSRAASASTRPRKRSRLCGVELSMR